MQNNKLKNLPQSRQDTNQKKLCGFVPLWQKIIYYFNLPQIAVQSLPN